MTKRSELDWLESDIEEFRRIIEENVQVIASHLGDVRNAEKHSTYLVVADLMWLIWGHAGAVFVLLREKLPTSALIVSRAIFEAQVTLTYLVEHPRFQDEAVIFLAFSYLRDIEHFSHQPKLVAEYSGILSRMSSSLVDEAKRRRRVRPRTWSGKTIRRMAEDADFTGYDPSYGFMSAEAHAAALGRHVRLERDGTMMKMKAGRSMSAEDIQSTANFARRGLHFAFKTMWRIFDGPKIEIHSRDPEEWWRRTT